MKNIKKSIVFAGILGLLSYNIYAMEQQSQKQFASGPGLELYNHTKDPLDVQISKGSMLISRVILQPKKYFICKPTHNVDITVYKRETVSNPFSRILDKIKEENLSNKLYKIYYNKEGKLALSETESLSEQFQKQFNCNHKYLKQKPQELPLEQFTQQQSSFNYNDNFFNNTSSGDHLVLYNQTNESLDIQIKSPDIKIRNSNISILNGTLKPGRYLSWNPNNNVNVTVVKTKGIFPPKKELYGFHSKVCIEKEKLPKKSYIIRYNKTEKQLSMTEKLPTQQQNNNNINNTQSNECSLLSK